MDPATINSLIGAGPVGVLAFMAYLSLQWVRADREQQREDRQERLSADRDRTETDKKLATAVTVLAMRVTGRPPGGGDSE